MAVNKARLASDSKQIPKKHHCPECGEEMKPVMTMPKRRMSFQCKQGHQKFKGETILR